MADTLTLDGLIELLKEVQPSLEDVDIDVSQSVTDDLGVDSLDLLQLSRRISRDFDLDFDLDSWAEQSAEHGKTVGSILAHLGVPVPA